MNRQTASGLTGSQRTAGLARRSWCSMPVSVATRTFGAVVVRAAASMPPVDSTRVRPGGRAPPPRLPQRGGRAPALGMDEQLGVWVGSGLAAQLVRADPGVHVAF